MNVKKEVSTWELSKVMIDAWIVSVSILRYIMRIMSIHSLNNIHIARLSVAIVVYQKVSTWRGVWGQIKIPSKESMKCSSFSYTFIIPNKWLYYGYPLFHTHPYNVEPLKVDL